jgi:hypothetical protein
MPIRIAAPIIPKTIPIILVFFADFPFAAAFSKSPLLAALVEESEKKKTDKMY